MAHDNSRHPAASPNQAAAKAKTDFHPDHYHLAISSRDSSSPTTITALVLAVVLGWKRFFPPGSEQQARNPRFELRTQQFGFCGSYLQRETRCGG
jgi:hypothetical protein